MNGPNPVAVRGIMTPEAWYKLSRRLLKETIALLMTRGASVSSCCSAPLRLATGTGASKVLLGESLAYSRRASIRKQRV